MEINKQSLCYNQNMSDHESNLRTVCIQEAILDYWLPSKLIAFLWAMFATSALIFAYLLDQGNILNFVKQLSIIAGIFLGICAITFYEKNNKLRIQGILLPPMFILTLVSVTHIISKIGNENIWLSLLLIIFIIFSYKTYSFGESVRKVINGFIFKNCIKSKDFNFYLKYLDKSKTRHTGYLITSALSLEDREIVIKSLEKIIKANYKIDDTNLHQMIPFIDISPEEVNELLKKIETNSEIGFFTIMNYCQDTGYNNIVKDIANKILLNKCIEEIIQTNNLLGYNLEPVFNSILLDRSLQNKAGCEKTKKLKI